MLMVKRQPAHPYDESLKSNCHFLQMSSANPKLFHLLILDQLMWKSPLVESPSLTPPPDPGEKLWHFTLDEAAYSRDRATNTE